MIAVDLPPGPPRLGAGGARALLAILLAERENAAQGASRTAPQRPAPRLLKPKVIDQQ